MNIIFDLGGVLITNDWDKKNTGFFAEFIGVFGVSEKDMDRGWRAGHDPFFTGRISENEFWKIFFKKAGREEVSEEDLARAKKIWRKHQKQDKNMLALLRKLKKNHILVGLTNLGREWADYKIKKYKLNRYFQTVFISGYLGVAKPDPEIYKKVLMKLGAEPEDCFFIDDRERNTAPAEILGFRTVVFKNRKELEKKLAEVGLL